MPINNVDKIKKILKTISILSHRKHSSLRNELIGKKASQIAKNIIVRTFINKQQNG